MVQIALSMTILAAILTETSNDVYSLPLGASNPEEAEAIVEGLERAQGKGNVNSPESN